MAGLKKNKMKYSEDFEREEFDSWKFSRLGSYYLNLYLGVLKKSDELMRIELRKVEGSIKKRGIDDKINLLKYIKFEKLRIKYPSENENTSLLEKIEKPDYNNVLSDLEK